MRRRTLLATLAIVPPSGAGCLSGSRPVADGGERTPTPRRRGPVRGEGDPIEVREVEDDDEVEYLPGEEAVRYVKAWRSTERDDRSTDGLPEHEPVYTTVPADRWGRIQALSAAGEAAARHAADELDADGLSGGVTSTIEGRDSTPIVTTSTLLDRSGDVVSRPSVTFEALVDATPGTAEVTYVLDDRAFDHEFAVFAKHSVIQQQ